MKLQFFNSLHTPTAISKDFKLSLGILQAKSVRHTLFGIFFKIIFFPDHGTIEYYMHPLLKELSNNEIQKDCLSSAQ